MDLIERAAAIEEFEDMVTSVSVYGESAEARYATNARIRFIEKLDSIPTVPAVPLDKLCEYLNSVIYPCIICKESPGPQCNAKREGCWERVLEKWMEGLDDHR